MKQQTSPEKIDLFKDTFRTPLSLMPWSKNLPEQCRKNKM